MYPGGWRASWGWLTLTRRVCICWKEALPEEDCCENQTSPSGDGHSLVMQLVKKRVERVSQNWAHLGLAEAGWRPQEV